MVSRSASGTKPTPAMAKLRRTKRDARARAMISMALGAMRRRLKSAKQVPVANFAHVGRGAKIAGPRQHEVVGIRRQAVHEGGGDAPVFLRRRRPAGESSWRYSAKMVAVAPTSCRRSTKRPFGRRGCSVMVYDRSELRGRWCPPGPDPRRGRLRGQDEVDLGDQSL